MAVRKGVAWRLGDEEFHSEVELARALAASLARVERVDFLGERFAFRLTWTEAPSAIENIGTRLYQLEILTYSDLDHVRASAFWELWHDGCAGGVHPVSSLNDPWTDATINYRLAADALAGFLRSVGSVLWPEFYVDSSGGPH